MGLKAVIFLTLAVLVVLVSRFLLKDLSEYYIKTCKSHYNIFRQKSSDFGDLLITIFISIVVGILSYLLYKTILVFFSYLLSDDLIEFFVLNRGVFTAFRAELQNPLLPKNLLMGILIYPIAQFFSIVFMVKSLKHFMYRVNLLAGNEVYSSSSLVFFSAFSCITFLVIELFAFTQSVGLVTTLSLLIVLIGAKLSYVIYYFSALHLELIGNESYRNAIEQELKLGRLEAKVLFSKRILLFTILIIASLLGLPLYSGFQFGENNWKIIAKIVVVGILFFFILKAVFSNGFNFIGVYLMDANKNHSIQSLSFPTSRYKRFILAGIVLLAILLLFLNIKSLFFISFFTIVIGAIAFLCLTFLSGVGTLFSKFFNEYSIDFSDWTSFVKSIYATVVAIISPVYLLALLMFTILTIFPKQNNSIQDHSNFVSSFVDNEGNLLFAEKDSTQPNPSIPIKFEDLPPFFVKALILKEDRKIYKQNSYLFNQSNWHGISSTGRSNINQQLIKNLVFEGGFPQELQRKFTEFITSYQLSKQSRPEEIINHYVNNVSFNGGAGHTGIVNGCFHTFGRSIHDINELEMLYLLFTLHRGSQFKISDDRNILYKEAHLHAEEIKEKLLTFANRWFKDGHITKKELNKLKKQSLTFTNQNFISNNFTSTKVFLSNSIDKSLDLNETYVTSISLANQNRMSSALSQFETQFAPYMTKDGCNLYTSAVVVDIKTGSIIGHYGGPSATDYARFEEGNPMASLIKPFVLLELLENGMAINLFDGPIKGKRTPNNFKDNFSNKFVDLYMILKKSLNMPMVNIREVTNDPIAIYKETEERFNAMNIPSDNSIELENTAKKSEYILNYPIGCRRMTVYDVAQAYQTLFNDGTYIKLHHKNEMLNPYTLETKKFEIESNPIFQANNIRQIKQGLKMAMEKEGTGYALLRYLPGDMEYMAKTGTSEKAIHGHTVLTDGETMVVAWVSYGRLINNGKDIDFNNTPPIPFNQGGATAGVFAAMILNEFMTIEY